MRYASSKGFIAVLVSVFLHIQMMQTYMSMMKVEFKIASHCGYIVTSKASWGGALSKVFLRRVGARCKADSAGCLVKLCVVSLEEGASKGQSGA